jgi:hypothetical protein
MSVLKVRNAANTDWLEVGGLAQDMSAIFDDDGDTRIMCEKSEDEDKIRFDTGGVERLVLDTTCKVMVPLDVRMANPLLRVIDTTVVSADDAQPLLYFMWGDTPTQLGYIGYGTPSNSELYIYTDEALNVYTGGSQNLIVSADGEVTTPLQPSFYGAGMESEITDMTDSTTYKVYWTELDDVGGDFNPANGQFTCPVDGWYQISASVNFNGWASDASDYRLNISTSNQAVYTLFAGTLWADNDSLCTLSSSACVFCDANDIIYIWIRQTGGTEQTDVYNAAPYTWCTIKLIG